MKKDKIIWFVLALMACLAIGWRIGFNQARYTAKLVEATESHYIIAYGDFCDYYTITND